MGAQGENRCAVCGPMDRLARLLVRLRHLMGRYHEQAHDRRPWRQCHQSPCVDVQAILADADPGGDDAGRG